jgi:PAS domain S-box-containing protein
MQDGDKTKEQLLAELHELRQRLDESEKDITERKETDKALRDSEAKYRRIVDTANEGIWSLDGNFITTFVNRRMAWMLGYDESEMIGQSVHWFMFEEDLADLREKMRDRRTGISDRYERRYRHIDGRSVWVILSVTPLIDDKDGSFKGSFAMVTDISDRKQMEEELLKSRHELELRVRERTAELERVNSQLRSIPAKLIAVQEDERKRIAGELHDSVGQTLAALKYAIETVLVKKDGGDLVGAFNLLERFVPTLQRSIDETRGIYMGLRPPMLDSLGLLATLEWFCREFQSLHSSYRLKFETKIKEEEIPDTIKVIIFRIAQEALNNAAKHSRAKRVNLSLAKSRSSIELTVKDDGEGFELDSVLSHNDLKSLGLTGMKDRAKQGGGIFSIESTPGKGTVLRASWPM